jgi:uncharacterized protein with HEPN domain
MSERSIILLLEDMYESTLKILQYVEGHDFNTFFEDEKTKDAVVRNFEIIGEAANNVNSEFRKDYPDIEWNRIRGFRNRIVHEYFGIDFEIVWSIIENDLPALSNQLKQLINKA